MVLAEEIEKEDSIFVLDFKRRNQSQKEGIFHGEYIADCGQSVRGNFQNNAEDRIGERRKSSQSACSGIVGRYLSLMKCMPITLLHGARAGRRFLTTVKCSAVIAI